MAKTLLEKTGHNADEFRIYSPQDYLNVPLQLNKYSWEEGPFGAYIEMDVTIKRTGEKVRLQTGSAAVITVFNNLDPEIKEPLDFQFKASGRRVWIE